MSQLLSLPAELLESILIYCNTQGHPSSVAALAQVCRQFHTLVYDAPDHHLWRALCLTTFDDPRLLRAGVSKDVDWQHAFTERIWAANFLQQNARPLPVLPKKRSLRSTTSMMYPIDSFPEAQDSDPEHYLRLLNALLSAVKTASPSPRRQVVSRSVEDSGLRRAHARTTVYPPSVQDQIFSLNIDWLGETLSHGLPFALAQYLFSWNVVGFGHNTVEIQTLCRLTAYLGFLPIPVVDTGSSNISPSSSSPSRKRRPAKSVAGSRKDRPAEVQDMGEAAQRARARPRTFSMRYLSRRRNWGPYLAILPRAANEPDCALGSPILAASSLKKELEDSDSDADSDADADYVPPDDASMSGTSSATSEPPRPAVDHAQPSAARTGTGTGTLPTPEQLHPDWAWLAAARIVAECKLRQHVDAEDIARLEDWDNLREGAWVPEPPSPGTDDDTAEAPAPVQETEEPVEEWRKYERDWAGAEGIWRRLVRWLDYEDLIYHSVSVPHSPCSCILTALTAHERRYRIMEASRTHSSTRRGSSSRCPSTSPATPRLRSRTSSPTGPRSTSRARWAAAGGSGASTGRTRTSAACTARSACSPMGTCAGPRRRLRPGRTRTSGRPRPCSSAASARRWARSGCGQARSTRTATRWVRTVLGGVHTWICRHALVQPLSELICASALTRRFFHQRVPSQLEVYYVLLFVSWLWHTRLNHYAKRQSD